MQVFFKYMYNLKICLDKISALYQTVNLNDKKYRPTFKIYVGYLNIKYKISILLDYTVLT